MIMEPLFLRVANGRASLSDAARALATSEDPGTSETAGDILSEATVYVHDFNAFISKFRVMLADIIDNGVTTSVKGGLDSYMEQIGRAHV